MSSADRPSAESPSDDDFEYPVPDYSPTIIEALFGDSARNRVLSVLVQNPTDVFLQCQLVRAIDVSGAMVSRACGELESIGILERQEDAVKDRYDGFQLTNDPLVDQLVVLAHVDSELPYDPDDQD